MTILLYLTGPYYRLWPYYQILGGFHRILQRVRLVNRGRLNYSSGHLVLSHLGLVFVQMLRPFSPELATFLDFQFRTSLSASILLFEGSLYPLQDLVETCFNTVSRDHWRVYAKTKRTRSDPVLWQKSYTNRKFNNHLTTQKRHQKLRIHKDSGPTKDGQLEKQLWLTFPLTANSCVIKRTQYTNSRNWIFFYQNILILFYIL